MIVYTNPYSFLDYGIFSGYWKIEITFCIQRLFWLIDEELFECGVLLTEIKIWIMLYLLDEYYILNLINANVELNLFL